MQGLALLNASEDRLTVIFPASSSLVPPTNSPIGCPTQQLASHAQPVRYAQPSSLTGPFSRPDRPIFALGCSFPALFARSFPVNRLKINTFRTLYPYYQGWGTPFCNPTPRVHALAACSHRALATPRVPPTSTQ